MDKVKILYIQPKHVQPDGEPVKYIPIGALIIYNDLIKLGINCEIQDIQNCSSLDCSLLAISHNLMGDKNIFYNICYIAKRKKIPIIIGGFAVDPEFIKKIIIPLEIQYAFIGEGDKIVAQIIKDILEKKDLTQYESSLYIKGKTLDINTLEYHVVPLEDISRINIPDEILSVCNNSSLEISRGCPKIPKCIFCSYSNNFRTRSLEDILADCKHFFSKKVLNVFFANSNFNQDIIFEIILKYPKIKFTSMIECSEFENYKNFILENNIDNLDLYIGIESFVPEKLKLMKKRDPNNIEMRMNIMRDCEKYNIPASINILVELPGETAEMNVKELEIIKNNDFIRQRCKIVPIRRLFYSDIGNNFELPSMVDVYLNYGEYFSRNHYDYYEEMFKDITKEK
jgi:hypothetical protein